MARLRLFKSQDRLEALLQQASEQELPYAEFLDQLLGEEVASKAARNIAIRTSLGKFPFVKGRDSFHFTYQPFIDKKQITTLASCHFIEHGENIVILGPHGVGKTHLSVGLGIRAIETGYRVVYDSRCHNCHVDQGCHRRSAGGQIKVLHGAALTDH
jgi:DNA replication protein DnaC